ncbi:MAG: hypothetical protein IJ106_04470 [Parasporobacterium sp.]|nr:hypothetical protein [Parasporobacterium sp.]
MTDTGVTVNLDSFEQRLVVKGMNNFRNELIRDEKPTEDVDDILLKIIDAPQQKRKRDNREAR